MGASGPWTSPKRCSTPQKGVQHPQKGAQHPEKWVQHPQKWVQHPQKGVQHPQKGDAAPQKKMQHPKKGCRTPKSFQIDKNKTDGSIPRVSLSQLRLALRACACSGRDAETTREFICHPQVAEKQVNQGSTITSTVKWGWGIKSNKRSKRSPSP